MMVNLPTHICVTRPQWVKTCMRISLPPLSLSIYIYMNVWLPMCSLWWRYNGHNSVSNHQPHDCVLNRLFRRRSKKTSKLRVTGLCATNSPVTDEFPTQMTGNAENVSIWWRHHESEDSFVSYINIWRWHPHTAHTYTPTYPHPYPHTHTHVYVYTYICIYGWGSSSKV